MQGIKSKLKQARDQIGSNYEQTQRRIVAKWIQVKHWRGFGVLALAYIALWLFLFVTSYYPWQERVTDGGSSASWLVSFPENIPLGFVVFGLLPLPGMFYVVWANLLRRTKPSKHES